MTKKRTPSADATTPETAPAIRDEAGRFKLGQSGNPTGRTVLPKSFRIAVREFMDGTGWDKLFRMAANERRTYKHDIQFRAIELIAGYAYGKPPQRHEIMTEDDGSRSVVDKLAALMAIQMGQGQEAETETVEGKVLAVFPGPVPSSVDEEGKE